MNALVSCETSSLEGRGWLLGPALRPSLRTVPWGQLTVGGVTAVVLALAAMLGDPSPIAPVDLLRVASVALAVGVAATFDDPTRPDSDHLPAPLWARRVVRLACAVVVTTTAWAICLFIARAALADNAPATALPVVDLTVVTAALVLATAAVAAAATRARARAAVPGAVAALTLPAAGLVLPRIIEHLASVDLTLYPRFVDLEQSSWRAAHQRWAVLAAVAALALAATVPSRFLPHRGARSANSPVHVCQEPFADD